MKKSIVVCFSMASLIVLLSCGNNEYTDCVRFDRQEIKNRNVQQLKGKVISFDEDVRTPMRIFCTNSILFLTNRGSSLFVDKYDLKTKKKLGSFLTFGSGPDELQMVSYIYKRDTMVHVFDQLQKNIYEYTLHDFCFEEIPKPKNVITIEEPASNVQSLPSGEIIATTFNMEEKRFSLFDRTGKFVKNMTGYPDFGQKMSPVELIESFIPQMVLSDDGSRIFVSHKRTDLIEVYTSNGKLIKRVQGPDGFFPSLAQSGSNDNMRVVPDKNKSKDAYFHPLVYKNEIWVMYSGKKVDPEQYKIYLNDSIFVFDWDGNFVRSYNLDIPIFTFAIDEENNKIYGITDEPEMSIIEFDILG